MKLFLTVFIAITFEDILCVNPPQVMDAISAAFGASVIECQKEVKFDNRVIREFLSYWDPHHQLEDREMGCVLVCVLVKLDLVQGQGDMKKENMESFVKASGADEQLLVAVIDAYEGCKHTLNLTEPCASGLRLGNCFRDKAFSLQWAPKQGEHYDETEY